MEEREEREERSRDGSQEGGGMREEEGKEWRRGKRERGREEVAIEGEESQGGEGRDWREKTWEGVKKIENAMPRRHVYQGTQESMAER